MKITSVDWVWMLHNNNGSNSNENIIRSLERERSHSCTEFRFMPGKSKRWSDIMQMRVESIRKESINLQIWQHNNMFKHIWVRDQVPNQQLFLPVTISDCFITATTISSTMIGTMIGTTITKQLMLWEYLTSIGGLKIYSDLIRAKAIADRVTYLPLLLG